MWVPLLLAGCEILFQCVLLALSEGGMSIKCFYSEADTGSRLEINEGKIVLENCFYAMQGSPMK